MELELGLGLNAGINSSLGLISGEGRFEVVMAVAVAVGWVRFDGGRSSGEDGLSMDLLLMEGWFWGRGKWFC